MRFAHTLLVALCCSAAAAQQIDLGADNPLSAVRRQHVELLTDKVTLFAGKPQDIDVVFRVDPGFHINSHMPKDELLIPTALKLDALAGLTIQSEQYPHGAPFKVAVGSDSELLDVYTGEFRVSLRVVVPRGNYTISGNLHYQACDNAACFPPRNLPVTLVLSAK